MCPRWPSGTVLVVFVQPVIGGFLTPKAREGIVQLGGNVLSQRLWLLIRPVTGGDVFPSFISLQHTITPFYLCVNEYIESFLI